MDTFAHGLWSYIIFSKSKYVWLAVLFGILPDLLSWTIWMFYRNKNGFTWGHPDLSLIPKWVFTLYGITHSLFVVALVFLIVFLVFKHIPIYLLAWPLHILIDIFTHTKDFLPTPFLWPFSNYAFPGISWGNMYFMSINYSLIAFFLIFINYEGISLFLSKIKESIKQLLIK